MENYNKNILLTIDLEEFDLPTEYGLELSFEEQINITNEGLNKLLGLLDVNELAATFFITSKYAEGNQGLVREISKKHEVASHSHSHGEYTNGDAIKSKQILEEICNAEVRGFRMPRFGSFDYNELKGMGYSYDSSINPTWIPGRYNNFFRPRNMFQDAGTGLTVLPLSVCPVIRFPLFWLSFKNIPFLLYSFCCNQTLLKDGYLHLYFHSWELADLSSFEIPKYIKRLSGDALVSRFERLIMKLKKQGNFITISDFLKQEL